MFHVSGIEMEESLWVKVVEYHMWRTILDPVDQLQNRPKTAILNGLIVPSVNHFCDRLLYSDSSTGSVPDWATQIASANTTGIVCHVLISGRALAGNRANLIVNVGTDGQMSDLLLGRLMAREIWRFRHHLVYKRSFHNAC